MGRRKRGSSRIDRERVQNLRNVRARMAKGFFTAAVCLLALVALQIQVFQSSKYRLHSDRNRLRKITIPAPRGLMVDRHGRYLAENIPSYSLYLIPFHVEQNDEILQRLGDVLILSEKRKSELVERLSQHTFSPVKIADNVDITIRSILEEHRGLIPGLMIRSEPLRFYHYGWEMAHVLGYVGEVASSDKAENGEQPVEEWGVVGKDGLELTYEDILRGRPGAYYVEVDARGKEIGLFRGREPAKPGRGTDIRLTIDLDLQLEANRLFPEGKRGAVLCLDPRNGEILAMVSRPAYDPNALVAGVSSARWREMVSDPGFPLFNRVSQASYPPGSTFKLVIAMIALEKGLVDLDFRMPLPCRGGIRYGNRWFRCWKKEGHGSLDLHQAIVQSCDSYFYQLGSRVGLEAIAEGAKALGFASPTEADLPNETGGFIPDPVWYDRRYGKRGWGRGVVLNLSIGQGEILVTPLQLASFYAMIANGGYSIRPHLILDNETAPRPVRPSRPMSVLDPLQKALAGVVMEPRGTAHYAGTLAGIEMAGKTGTAQNPHGEDHSIFVGYAPLTAPEVLAVAIVEGGGHGSSVAAPLVSQLLRRYIELSGRKAVVDMKKEAG